MSKIKIIKILYAFLVIYLISPVLNKKFSFSKKSKISNLVRKLESQNFITKIYYSEKDNNYYVKLYQEKDTTTQTQSYLLDTTFSLISSPCNLCKSCHKHSYPFFTIDNEKDIFSCNSTQCSSIINPTNCESDECHFKVKDDINSDKNLEGILVHSTIYINNMNENNFEQASLSSIPIGCTTEEGKFYKNKEINGILGLNNNNNTFVDNIYNLKYIKKNLFTICLSKKGGFLSLGDIVNNSYDNNNIAYINLLNQTQNVFNLKIKSFQIGEQKINLEYISYIDSSNKLSYFPKNLYNEITKKLISEIEKKENKTNLFEEDEKYGLCRIYENRKDEENIIYEMYPFININFGGYNYDWKPQSYIVDYEIPEQKIVKSCFGFKSIENKDNNNDNNSIILGINFMIDHDIIFDKTNQKIAIINSDCEQIEMNDDKKNSEGHSNENGKINYEINKQNNNETNKNNTESNILSSDIIDKNENNNSFNKNESNINKSEYTENISYSSNNNNASISSTINLEKNNSTLNNTNDTNTEISDISSSIINSTIISNVSNTSMNIIDNETLNITNSSTNINNNSNMNITINSIINYTNKSQSDSYVKDTIIEKNEIKIAKTSFIISSTLINNKIISKIDFEKTTEKIEENQNKNISSTSINKVINLITDNKIENSKNNMKSEDKWDFEESSHDKKEMKNKNDNDKYKRGENAYLRDKSFSNTIFRMLKSFIRNKLIYFLLALIGLIGGFFLIILISCAIISCIRFVKKKNYMEQIDEDVPKYSKYNSASLTSRSN
jgi:hypothetical protein